MAFDFPNTPTVGQVFNGWVWDGAAWQVQGAATYGAVRYDIAQGLLGETPPYGVTVTQRAQARQNVYAAPFDALANLGLQVNGSCNFSQTYDNSVGVTIPSGTLAYWADNWEVTFNRAATWDVFLQRLFTGSSPVSLTPPPGYTNSLSFRANVGLASLAAGDYCAFVHPIEGIRISRLAFGTVNAQPVTIGFWVWSTVAGNCSVVVQNDVINRSYATLVNIPNAGAWNWVTTTIPGDIAGTWLAGAVLAMRVVICPACGTTQQIAPNVWTASIALAATGQPNLLATTGNVFAVTGLGIWPGVEAPSAARSALVARPFVDDLRECKRYAHVITGANDAIQMYGYNIATSTPTSSFVRDVEMRAPAPVSLSGSPWTVSNCGQPVASIQGAKVFSMYVTVTALGAYAANMATGSVITALARL
jgi:hypothetical protein